MAGIRRDDIRNSYGWTLKKLLEVTYQHPQFQNRYQYMERDVLRRITIREVTVWDAQRKGAPSVKYVIESNSYPQYFPYFTKRDKRGRRRGYQRSYKHEYDVTLELSRLSINTTGIKLRTGADRKWRFGREHRARKDKRGRVIEGTNQKMGINGDFFFRSEYVFKQNGILFGRDWTNGPPSQTNPNMIPFLDKHMLRTVTELVNRGILKDD